jgi:hypothetical protein
MNDLLNELATLARDPAARAVLGAAIGAVTLAICMLCASYVMLDVHERRLPSVLLLGANMALFIILSSMLPPVMQTTALLVGGVTFGAAFLVIAIAAQIMHRPPDAMVFTVRVPK